jgi:bifunctional non-homologous end joining protein LigD
MAARARPRPAATGARKPARKRATVRAKTRSTSAAESPQLAQYRKKRDFTRTPEPQGKRPMAESIFVIQKHAATRLHYDFRLALDGTLKSWAVAKGPSLNPNDRRLAVHVEDHPMDYANFEGIIPKGQYGGGTVMVWDTGTWEPIGDARAAYKKGHLEFVLKGRKLKGRWHLVRMRPRPGEEDKDYWLLIKGQDDEANDDEDILARDRSVLSQRSMDEIAAPAHGKPKVWQSHGRGAATLRTEAQRRRDQEAEKQSEKGSSGRQKPTKAKPRAQAKEIVTAAIKARGSDALPDFVPPELATLVDKPPASTGWVHELKLDGYRIFARIERGKCRLLTRRGLDWTHKFAALGDALTKLPARTAALDGEICVLDEEGVSDFGALQDALSRGRTEEVVLFAFDLLHQDGVDLRRLPLIERKARLKDLLERSGIGPESRPGIIYSEHFTTEGHLFFQSACQMALEGIVSKRGDRPYVSGRTADWVKSKCRLRQEFVIGGYTDRTNSPRHIGALLLGYYESGALRYCGKIGTGMDEATQASLYRTLNGLRTEAPPFSARPPDSRDATWVTPDVVCEVEFHGWTRDDRLRQGSFQGVRADKKPTEIVRERPISMDAALQRGKRSDDSIAEEAPVRPSAKASSVKPRHVKASMGRKAAQQGKTPPAALPRLTHPDRVLLGTQGLTKQQLADYYVAIADYVLPYIVDRPLSLVRCPQGQKRCFYQKHPSIGMSDVLDRIAIQEKGKTTTEDYLVVRDLSGLIELVQFGTLEIHPWGSRTDDVETPDQIIFDLDPDPSVKWPQVVDAAFDIRASLESVGLRSFAKVTGGKGLHVVIPIAREHQWPTVKNFARTFAEFLAGRAPDKYTTNLSKKARTGRIFIDYLRNERGSTAIAPYSTRAREGAPVAVPVSWDEVNTKLDPAGFDIDSVRRRLRSLKRDPWRDFFTVKQGIDRLAAPAAAKDESPRKRRRSTGN